MNVEVTGAAVPHMSRHDIVTFARKVLLAADASEKLREVSIALINDRSMRALNRKFRGKKKTTDVLTFPGDGSCEIVISVDRARRQSAQEKHSLPTEIRYLILHGILHGLGYDHTADRGEMDELEMEVRDRVGLM